MKKIAFGAAAALVLSMSVFAQEVSVSFENKISSDVVYISEGNAEFAGIKEQVTAEIETEKVNAGVSLITNLEKNADGNIGFTDFELDKAYVEFKPFDFMSIDFNKKVFTKGSYLPIADDNVGNGNIASDISLVFRPIENLSVAGGLKIPSIFADGDGKADFSAGVDYSSEKFSVGASLRNPVTNLGFGIFGSFTGVEKLTLNMGFSYNDEMCDIAGNLITLGATYEVSMFTIGFDFVSNFGNDGLDLYTALCVETGFTDNFILETQATVYADYADASATETIAEIGGAYVNGNHKLRAGIAFDITDTLGVFFPVYYKYKF